MRGRERTSRVGLFLLLAATSPPSGAQTSGTNICPLSGRDATTSQIVTMDLAAPTSPLQAGAFVLEYMYRPAINPHIMQYGHCDAGEPRARRPR